MKGTRKSEALLPGTKECKPSTEVRIYEIAEGIVNSGWTRQDVLKYITDNWNLSPKQAYKYYYAAMNYMRPDDPAKYREALINRNFDVLETIMKRALDRGDFKEANNAIKTMNQMLGVGGKSVEVKDFNAEGLERKIVISFGD